MKRKWSAVIMRHLEAGITTPEEITRREPELSALAMNDRLRTMLRYQLIEKLPRWKLSEPVCYRLTPRGRNILRILEFINLLDQVPAHDRRTLEELAGLQPNPPSAKNRG